MHLLTHCHASLRTFRTMSRQTYRKRLEKTFGRPFESGSDQDVAHIISRKHGGADHPDNYDYVRGRRWNRMTQHRFDDINCFLAGRDKCQKAVDISKRLGTYDGPSADELYERGERLMKLFLEHVSAHGIGRLSATGAGGRFSSTNGGGRPEESGQRLGGKTG